jgi:hypothetical protein
VFQIEPLACVGDYREKLIKCTGKVKRSKQILLRHFGHSISDFTKKLCVLFHRNDYFLLHRTSRNIKQKAFVNQKSRGDNLWEWRSVANKKARLNLRGKGSKYTPRRLFCFSAINLSPQRFQYKKYACKNLCFINEANHVGGSSPVWPEGEKKKR